MFKTGPQGFGFGVATNSFANLNSAVPGGDYVFTVSNVTTVSVNLPASRVLQNAPSLSNYDAAQSIDASKDFSLGWGAFNGGTAMDSITVDVRDALTGLEVFQSEKYGCPDALNGTSTSLLIPANTLTTNQTCQVTITFIKVLTLDTNSIPNVALLAGIEAETQVTIATSPGATVPPASALVLTNAAWLPGGSARFRPLTTPASLTRSNSTKTWAIPRGGRPC